MGACATKPKVLKEKGQAPVPEPQPEGAKTAVVDDIGAGKMAKEEEQTEIPVAGEDDKEKEITVVEAEGGDDDQSSKRRSLSHLFKENEDKKKSSETGIPEVLTVEERSNPAELVTPESTEQFKPEQLKIEEKVPEESMKQEESITEKSITEPVAEQLVSLSNPAKPVTSESAEQIKQEQLEKAPEDSMKQEAPITENPVAEPEKQEEQTVTEVPKTEEPVDIVKQEEPLETTKPEETQEKPSVTEKSIEISEIKFPTDEKSEVPVQQIESEAVVDKSVKEVKEKVIETVPEAEHKTSTEQPVEGKPEEAKHS